MSAQAPRLTPSFADQIKEALAPSDPAFAYVFGSYGTSSQHPNSDLDIAFMPRAIIPPLTVFNTANALSTSLHIEVDLVDLTHASTVFRKEVYRTGTPFIIADPFALSEFEMYTLSAYARLNEERQRILFK